MAEKLNVKKLEKAVREFYSKLDSEPDTLEEMARVTKGRPKIPAEAVKKLTFTDAELDELYVTQADKEQGKLGASFIASVLSVHPDNYSDEQYYKVLNKGLHKLSFDELRNAIEIERRKHRIYHEDYME